MSDTNPTKPERSEGQHTQMTDEEFDLRASKVPLNSPLIAEARRARCSEAALKARVASLEKGLRQIADLGDEHGCFPRCDCYSPEATRIWMEEVKDAARALLSPRDGEAK